MSDVAAYLDRCVGGYVTGNIHVTPSSILSHRMLSHAAAVIGTDRNKFGYTNANRLLKL